MSRVGVDIDDVLFPWYDMAHEVCVEAGITNGVQATSWAPFEDYGITRAEWLNAIQHMQRDGTYLRAPIGGAAAALWELRHAGHSIHLVTARGAFRNGPAIKRDTVKWLADWNVPYDTLTFAQDKGIVRVDYFIDDRIKHLTEVYDAGHVEELFLVDRPYNRNDRDAYWYTRVDHIRDAVAVILQSSPAVVA